jgi:CheY-like chemotaxis protein
MNGVIGATDLALSEAVPPKVNGYLKIVQSSAYSLLGIIDDILDFSKIEAHKIELKERVFRLSEVFERIMELFFNKASEKGVELLVDIDMDTPKVVVGDPLRLQQILTNLVSNAVKFTESGGVILISVKALEEPRQGSTGDELMLAFSVKDTGTGIDPEYIDRLFEPFSQADMSSTRKYEGTGLGLSICKQLVTLMGGDIEVQSQLGQGSTFSFTVRLRRAPAAAVSVLKVPADIQGLNVLVVDDLADSRIIMRRILESLGFRVETLDSGARALSRMQDKPLRDKPVDLIMMDWKMEGMDGIEVSRRIRQELNLDVPIIMMTAFGREEQRVEAEKAGINGFLTKPIYPSTLFDAIMDGFGKEGLKVAGRGRRFTTRASIYRKPLKGLRILVAEDNPTNQQVTRAILEGAEISVTIANNGEEAVEAVRTQPVDAVLMDIQMPKMNGYEATRRIRELPQGASLPIIAMTAHAMKGDEEKCLEAGMDGYIAKPVNQDRLFHSLWRFLKSRKALPEPPAPEAGEAAGGTGAEPGDAPAEEQRYRSEKYVESGRPLPGSLPGIHVGEALEALKIDFATLAGILKGFLADNRDTAEKLQQAFSRNDIESLRRLAHGLKGSAANIGAAELSQIAYELENACREAAPAAVEPSRLEDRINRLGSALSRVLESIQSLEEPVPTEEPLTGPVESGLDLTTLLRQLSEAIDRADPEQVMKIMPAVRRQAARSRQLDALTLKTLEDQVNRYDYDQAQETIRNIMRNRQGVS